MAKNVTARLATNQAVKAVPSKKNPQKHAGCNECNVQCKSM